MNVVTFYIVLPDRSRWFKYNLSLVVIYSTPIQFKTHNVIIHTIGLIWLRPNPYLFKSVGMDYYILIGSSTFFILRSVIYACSFFNITSILLYSSLDSTTVCVFASILYTDYVITSLLYFSTNTLSISFKTEYERRASYTDLTIRCNIILIAAISLWKETDIKNTPLLTLNSTYTGESFFILNFMIYAFILSMISARNTA